MLRRDPRRADPVIRDHSLDIGAAGDEPTFAPLPDFGAFPDPGGVVTLVLSLAFGLWAAYRAVRVLWSRLRRWRHG